MYSASFTPALFCRSTVGATQVRFPTACTCGWVGIVGCGPVLVTLYSYFYSFTVLVLSFTVLVLFYSFTVLVFWTIFGTRITPTLYSVTWLAALFLAGALQWTLSGAHSLLGFGRVGHRTQPNTEPGHPPGMTLELCITGLLLQVQGTARGTDPFVAPRRDRDRFSLASDFIVKPLRPAR